VSYLVQGFNRLLTVTWDRVPIDVHVFKGLPHGFRRFGEQLTESERWDKVMEEGIRWALSRPDPSWKVRIQS
jgi:hypothetical protein